MPSSESGFPASSSPPSARRAGFIALLTGLSVAGLVSGINSLQIMIHENSPHLSWQLFVIPLIFFVTLTRFIIGNLLHFISIEHGTSKKEWIKDLLIIIGEYMLFIFLGAFTYNGTVFFFPIFIMILIIDIFWVLQTKLRTPRILRLSPNVIWASINIVTLAILIPIALIQGGITVISSDETFLIVSLALFIVAATFDVGYTIKRVEI